MIKLKLKDNAHTFPDLQSKMDDFGWYPLAQHGIFEAADFKLCLVEINGTVYDEHSEEFQKAYDKAIVWHRLES